jgi:CheY-like chemotaxis protein
MTIPYEGFMEQVRDAYEHLYDLVYLRSHPLVECLLIDAKQGRHERAWQFHELLINALDELDPGPQAPVMSKEWRRHRLMVFRFIDGLDPQAVADQLAISLRQYYREFDASIAAISSVLWDLYMDCTAKDASSPVSAEDRETDHLQLLRLEAARASVAERRTHLGQVVGDITSLLAERLTEHQVHVFTALPAGLPIVTVAQSIVRQLLMAVIGFMAERARDATLRLSARSESDTVELALELTPAPPAELWQVEVQERIDSFREMAALGGGGVTPRQADNGVGFDIALPCGGDRVILVVDDSEDTLDLISRMLSPYGYVVERATTAAQAIEAAARVQPIAVLVDLMMPGQDGWDLLRALSQRDDTRRLPVIVCSVLQQRELALALGATAYITKPVNSVALVSLLRDIASA